MTALGLVKCPRVGFKVQRPLFGVKHLENKSEMLNTHSSDLRTYWLQFVLCVLSNMCRCKKHI